MLSFVYDQGMINETFSDWLHRVTEGAFASDIAKNINVPSATVSGWLRKNNPSFQGVLKIAVAYNLNPLLAFVEAGLVPRTYLPAVENIKSLQSISKKDLLEEIMRRELKEEALRNEAIECKDFRKNVSQIGEYLQWFKKFVEEYEKVEIKEKLWIYEDFQ